ncbi:glutamate receptor ionotropic, delta-2 [Bicyclus anynana]|uniref:Glutamate receptor ionotropic, delta-2 n=1 Tax=Bicyclus anynana TaxID=110368 RepID=A0A6J1MYS1_BICAN|nr:glutamate receptor ionotropic, delta-2 [Bicyclus anynana]
MILLPEALLPIEILLQMIIKKSLASSYCITMVSEVLLKVHVPNSLMYIDGNNTESLVELMLNASEAGCSDYIIQIKEPKDFIVAFDKVVHMGNIRRSDRRVIILPPKYISDENVFSHDLLEILSLRETSYITNVLLVVPTKKTLKCESYELITHKFVGIDNNKEPMLLDRWDSCTNSFENNVNLFPHDLSNLQGKTVKVAGFTYKPYVLLDLDTKLMPLGRDGMEMRIVDEFCRWINCTVEMVRDDEHEWGEIYDNSTGVGVIGNVFEDRADLGITALYSWFEEYVVMDFSAPIIRTAITCIAPSPSLLASWEMPLLPFSVYMWAGIIFTFLYASVALTIAKGFSTDEVFLTTFGIMLTQSRPDASFRSWRIRSVIGWMMMTGLVIDNAYGGGLASTFTVPKYEKSIDTIEDIVNRQLEWGATHDAWIFSLMLSQEPLIKQLLSLFRTYPSEELMQKSFRKSMAFSIEKLPAGYFAIGEYITKEASLDYTIMIDKFYYEQCIVMLRKSSPYTDKLNVLIGRLHESGLMLAWETQVALRYLDYKVQLEVKLSRSKRDVENIEALGLRHVMGIFFIYGAGAVISCLVFIMEILIHRKSRKISIN